MLQGQPHNPMVNSGAIMSASILLHLVKPEMNMAQKYDYVFAFFKVKHFFCYSIKAKTWMKTNVHKSYFCSSFISILSRWFFIITLVKERDKAKKRLKFIYLQRHVCECWLKVNSASFGFAPFSLLSLIIYCI